MTQGFVPSSTAPVEAGAALDAPVLRPVARADRIAEMDYVRGLAVLGIFMVNMPLYNSHMAVYFNNEATGWFKAWYDQAALWFIRVVAESKFYSLFSFLFGLGFGVQMARAGAAGVQGFGRHYSRRLGVLFGLGLVHMLLFWWGDVLHLYALVGFTLLLFRKRTQKTVVIWALAFLLFPVIGGTVYFTQRALRDDPQKQAERDKERQERRTKMYKDIEEQTRTFASGSRWEVQKLRLDQVRHHLPGEILWGTEIFTMFLLGLWFARSGILLDVPGNLGLFRRWLWWGLGGVGVSLVLAGLKFRLGDGAPDRAQFVIEVLRHVVARPLHALFYGAGVVLLVQQEYWRRLLAPMAAVGRMALSSYLTHTVVCVTLFNGVGFGLMGFGLFGRVGPAAGLALTVVIYVVQLGLSAWWLGRYRYGPLEWAWRSLTYGRKQPMTMVA